MAEILPTPAAGTWLKITGAPDPPDQMRAGTWFRILPDGMTGAYPRAGTWLRIDSVGFATKRPRTSVGILVARTRSAGHVDS